MLVSVLGLVLVLASVLGLGFAQLAGVMRNVS